MRAATLAICFLLLAGCTASDDPAVPSSAPGATVSGSPVVTPSGGTPAATPSATPPVPILPTPPPLPEGPCDATGYSLAVTRAAAVAVNDLVYVFGGFGEDGARRDSIVKFNVTTGVVAEAGKLPAPRADISAVAANGRVYLIGGSSDEGLVTDVLRYNPGGETWNRVATMREGRRDFGLVAAEEAAYLIGGVNSRGTMADIDVFDFASNGFTDAEARLPAPRSAPGIIHFPGTGEVLVAGGVDAAGRESSEVVLFDIEADTATPLTRLPTPIRDQVSFYDDATKAGYLMMGVSEGDLSSTILRYNATNPSKAFDLQQAECDEPRIGASAVGTSSGVFIIGGQTPAGALVRTIVRFDPDALS